MANYKHSANRLDLLGQRFGRLVVISEAENRITKSGQYKAYWLCQCDCGKQVEVSTQNLRRGTKSCGCLRVELGREKRTHGLKNTRLYSIWAGIKDRCHNPNSKYWERYGGRGIQVCKEWRTDFMNFYHWAMDNGYDDELTLDRIDNKRGYNPENCRWATWETQENNRTNNVRFSINGHTHTVAEWSRIFEIPRHKLQDLIDREVI